MPTPSPAQQTPNGNPSTGPAAPGSPQSNPGNDSKNDNPKTDSVQDIRDDMDHEPGGLGEVHPDDQDRLEDSFPLNPDGTPQRFPDPFGDWVQLQNDGGNTVPGRSNNCADCTRSFLESYRGNPQVSAPRTLDTDENGNLDPWAPEDNANENQIRFAGAPHEYAGPGDGIDPVSTIENDLLAAGHGAHSIVQVDWPGGGGHSFAAVNHNGTVVYVDTQSGEVSTDPLHIDQAEHVWHIPMDPDGNPLRPAEADNDADASENQSDDSESQNKDESQPENSENNEQPDSDPQNDTSDDDAPKQGEEPDTSTDSPTATDPTTPDASENGDTTQPSTTDPDSTPDPTNNEPENENGQPQSESDKPAQQDASTPDSQEPSQDTAESGQPSPDNNDADTQPQQSPSPETPSEQTQPTPAETPSTPNQQSHPDDPTGPDEQGRNPDKESQQPTSTTESPARPDSPSEHRESPTHTTPDKAENGTPDRDTAPPRTATDNPSDPTTNRDTPHQNTTPSDPRTSLPHQKTGDPRTTDPRSADPRTTDPRTSDPRTSDPRTPDPHRDTPTQEKPDTSERPDSQHPNTSPRPDQTRPDHLDDPRSETPDKDPSETPDQARPDDSDQSPAEDHRERPSDMNKDSAVPTRESLPDGKNADASSYVKDSTRGKDPLYGPIADERPAGTARPDSDSSTPPRGPAEPAAGRNDDGKKKAFVRKMVDFANESKENRKKYWNKNGNRNSLDDRVEGQRLPQLKPDPNYPNDPDDPEKYIAASDVPPPDAPDYMPESIVKPVDLGRDDGQITPENLANMDAETNDREWTLQADRIAEAAKLQAKEDHGEDSDEYKAAKRVYADTHSAVRDIGESHGENAALHHAMASQHPDYVLVDVPKTGNGSDQFDQIYENPDKPGHYIVVEAKAPTGQLGERKGHSGQKVMQGTREYFETIYMLMRDGTPEQKEIAEKLEAAYELGNVQYVLVQSKVESDPEANAEASNGNHDGGYLGEDGHRERKRYGGATMEYFDIRKPEDR